MFLAYSSGHHQKHRKINHHPNPDAMASWSSYMSTFCCAISNGIQKDPIAVLYIYIHILSHALVMKSLEISPYIPLNPVKSNYCHHYIYIYVHIHIYTTYIPIGWRTRGSFIFENGHKPWRLDENHHGSNVGFT